MAKKRSAPKSPSTAAPGASGKEPFAPVDTVTDHAIVQPPTAGASPSEAVSLAWPVASIVNLENLFVDEFHAKRNPEGLQPADELALSFETGPFSIGKNPDQKKLFVKIQMSVRVAKKGVLATTEPAIRIECQFVLIYAIPTFEGITDDQLGAFAQTSGVFNVWPYWRQAVHAVSLQLGIPAIVLPTHRVSGEKSPGSTVSNVTQNCATSQTH